MSKQTWVIIAVAAILLWVWSGSAHAAQATPAKYSGPQIDPSTGDLTPFAGPDVDPVTGNYTGGGRVTRTLTIDANVYSPTFGDPIDAQASGA